MLSYTLARAGLALFVLLFALGACGPSGPIEEGGAATAAARVKSGMESLKSGVDKQAGIVETAQALATQAPTVVAKAGTAVAPAVGTVQAVVPTVAAGGGGQVARDQVEARAKTEASRVLGVPAEQITVDRVEQVEWRDASLGCADPDKMYAQVITPGYRVVLSAGGQRVEVHTDMSGRYVVCRNPTQ